MIKVAAWCQDPSDATLRQLTQLGVDCVDALPLLTDDRGVFDLDEALKMKIRVHSWRMALRRSSTSRASRFESLARQAILSDGCTSTIPRILG